MAKALALILPSAHKATGDAIAIALGYAPTGEETYTAELSATGSKPATHYGCHARSEDAFIGLIQSVKAGGPLPSANWQAAGTNEADVMACIGAIQMRAADLSEYTTNFNDALAQAGLSTIKLASYGW